MNHPVLWVLDTEIDDRSFERLCTDLLFRNGYPDIIPYGGSHDRGRDAEVNRHKRMSSSGEPVFLLFQYSLEKTWQKITSRGTKKGSNEQTQRYDVHFCYQPIGIWGASRQAS
jgi:hypothetical protein